MKKLLFVFLFIFSTLTTYAQKDKTLKDKDTPPAITGIDPRQFVTLYELSRPTNRSNTIFRNDSIKINTIDVNSLITITFDHEKMKKNKDYYGNVSIRAEIDDELIKVAPYSKVGEKQSEIGVKTATPNEVSAHFISMLERMQEMEIDLENLYIGDNSSTIYIVESGSLVESNSYDKSLDEFMTNYFQSITPKDSIIKFEKLSNTIKKRIKAFSAITPELALFSNGDLELSSERIADILKEIKKKRKIADDDGKDKITLEIINNCKKLKKRIEVALNYFDYFRSKEDEELTNLFLRLTKQDKLTIDQLYKELNVLKDIITSLDFENYTKKEKELGLQLFFTFKLVQSYNKNISSILYDYDIPISKLKSDTFDQKNTEYLERREIVKKLGTEIAELIYQRLFNAKVDLRTSRAKSGQILKISILWYRDDSSEPMVLPVGQFKLKQVGWRTNIFDSFLLINRYSTPTNDENISPSNFKGSPGVSLIRTLGNNGSNKLIRKIEPSFGINVSYLDFYENKDLEVGVGAIIGLFNNKVFLTFGHNLHAEGSGGYLGVGFSFANIAGQLKK